MDNTLQLESLYQRKAILSKLRTKKTLDKLLFWFVFFMAYPSILIVFNLNIYIFPFLLYYFHKRHGYFFKLKSIVQLFAIAFIVGSFLATFNSTDFDVSASVLPNYIYWGLVIIFFVAQRDNINYQVIFRALTVGLIVSTISYFFLGRMVASVLPFIRPIPQNAYAFLLICFTPIMIYHIKTTRGNIASLYAYLIVLVCAFLSGSRAGAILVMFGGGLAYLVDKINLRNGVPTFLVMGILAFILESTGLAPFFIMELNPETYDLIYKSDQVFKMDVSYLTRVAMVEKGMNIFNEKPVYGIGLNLFKSYHATIEGKTEWIQLFNFKMLETGISSHNSYINLLAEGGLVLFVPSVLIMGYCVLLLIFRFNSLPNHHKVVLFGAVAMCIHFYFVAAILNVFAWFNIAIAATLAFPPKTKKSRKYIMPLTTTNTLQHGN